MTRDDDLIRELERMAACKEVVNDSEREMMRKEIAYYKLACRLSNGTDKKRNSVWTDNAMVSKKELERFFKVLTGRPYFDAARFKSCSKCEEA